MNTRLVSILVFAAALASLLITGVTAQRPAPFTLDDEMKIRAIVDVRISPDGERVAYVMSTPSLPKNEHEAALFVVPTRGGESTRLGDAVHIFNHGRRDGEQLTQARPEHALVIRQDDTNGAIGPVRGTYSVHGVIRIIGLRRLPRLRTCRYGEQTSGRYRSISVTYDNRRT